MLDPKTGDQKWNEDLKGQFSSLYGAQPKVIQIMFPPVPPEMFFQQWRKRYGSGAMLKCKGDGQSMSNPGEAICGKDEWAAGLDILSTTSRGMFKVKCLGEDCIYSPKECSVMGSLQVILPQMKGIGVWQISTGSWNSIVNINSGIDWLRGLCGRHAMIPINLMRVPQEMAHDGKKSTHYPLQIDQNSFSIADLQKAALIEPTRALLPEIEEEKPEEVSDFVTIPDLGQGKGEFVAEPEPENVVEFTQNDTKTETSLDDWDDVPEEPEEAVETKPEPKPVKLASEKQIKAIYGIAKGKGVPIEQIEFKVRKVTGNYKAPLEEVMQKLTTAQASELITNLQETKDAPPEDLL